MNRSAMFAIFFSMAAEAYGVAPVLRNGGTIGPDVPPLSCTTPTVRSSLPAEQVQALGIHTVGETVEFHVPPNTGTISIIEQAVNSPPQTILFGAPPNASAIPNAAVATLITEPNGTVLFDDNADPPADESTAHLLAVGEAGTGVVTLPNTTQALADSAAGGYPPGRWTVQVNDYALECLALPATCSGGTNEGQYDLTVITKPVANPTGTIDISVYLATESLDATRAVENPSMQRYVQTLGMIYDKVGIALGSITVYDLPPWAKARYASVDAADTGPCSELGQLLALSLPGNAINFFFVDAVQLGAHGGMVVGIDGSIPGPASLGGTVTSGAVVTVSDLGFGTCRSVHFGKCGADAVAYISAHEGGHFMGLVHTTEASGDHFDPLRDTPKCMCSRACLSAENAALCGGKTFHLTSATCAQRKKPQCGGGDNLMFWMLDTNISAGSLTEEQGKVMRANPVVH